VLEQQLRALRPLLAGAGIAVTHWLDALELSEVIRTGFDPHATTGLDRRSARLTTRSLTARSPPCPPAWTVAGRPGRRLRLVVLLPA